MSQFPFYRLRNVVGPIDRLCRAIALRRETEGEGPKMTTPVVRFVSFRPLSPLRLPLDKRDSLPYMRAHA